MGEQSPLTLNCRVNASTSRPHTPTPDATNCVISFRSIPIAACLSATLRYSVAQYPVPTHKCGGCQHAKVRGNRGVYKLPHPIREYVADSKGPATCAINEAASNDGDTLGCQFAAEAAATTTNGAASASLKPSTLSPWQKR